MMLNLKKVSIILVIILITGGIWSWVSKNFNNTKTNTTNENVRSDDGTTRPIAPKVESSSESKVVLDSQNDDAYQGFINTHYGIALQYPSDWVVVETKPDQMMNPESIRPIFIGETVLKVDFSSTDVSNTPGSFTLTIYNNPSNLSLEEWRQEQRNEYVNRGKDCVEPVPLGCPTTKDLVESGEQTRVADQLSYADILFNFDHTAKCITTMSNQYVYQFCFEENNPNVTNFQATKEITSRMLQTVKFLKLTR